MNIKGKIFNFDVWKANAFDEFLEMGLFSLTMVFRVSSKIRLRERVQKITQNVPKYVIFPESSAGRFVPVPGGGIK